MKNFYSIFISISFFAFIILPEKGTQMHIKAITSQITDNSLKNINVKSTDWLTHGLNYAENRFSPFVQINQKNIAELGLVWSLELGTTRGIEATPLVVDGIMFLTGPWSVVYAIDIRKGKKIWQFDPKVPKDYGEKACCDVVNRGLALYKGNLYLGALDGRLIAIDAATGKQVWSKITVDQAKPYTITGAPRIVNGKVIIGNGGAEYGVRGYISAYDALSGNQVWRIYTVPGNPNLPFENKAMEIAAKTWTGEWWKYGGGGTAWDAMAFDPKLNLLYIGTGNGSPWDRKYRSPEGGDNLYLSSILALNPDTGDLVWHYQTTPGDSWDFTATQPLVLADIKIQGVDRQVIMQAPKNGFFYVIDRKTGEFISADPFVYVTWAKGFDQTTGRPIEADFARYETVNTDNSPTYNGGHNWHPMAFNPNINMMYIPGRDNVATYGHDPTWSYNTTGFGTGNGWNLAIGYDPSKPLKLDTIARKFMPRGLLIAWDPSQRKEIWRVQQNAEWNGGVLATAANIVFQGTGEGDFIAFDGKTGKQLWKKNLGGGILAPPISYLMDGKQYISIAVGWGGANGIKHKYAPLQTGKIYTFAIGGKKALPVYKKEIKKPITRYKLASTQTELASGAMLFGKYCAICHELGSFGGLVPDLARMSQEVNENFMQIVHKGAYLQNGMPKFEGRLSEKEVAEVHKFILNSAEKILKK